MLAGNHDSDSLNRLTVIFLEAAELRVKERKDLTLPFWRGNVDKLLTFNDKPIWRFRSYSALPLGPVAELLSIFAFRL